MIRSQSVNRESVIKQQTTTQVRRSARKSSNTSSNGDKRNTTDSIPLAISTYVTVNHVSTNNNDANYTEATTLKQQNKNIRKNCRKILNKLFDKEHLVFAWPFYKPVDVVKLKLYDYYEKIKQPMDLGTIKKKLKQQKYKTVEEFTSDVRLVFSNCYTYNPPNHEVVAMAEKLENVFEDCYAEIQIQPSQQEMADSSQDGENNKNSTSDYRCNVTGDEQCCEDENHEEWLDQLHEMQEQLSHMQNRLQTFIKTVYEHPRRKSATNTNEEPKQTSNQQQIRLDIASSPEEDQTSRNSFTTATLPLPLRNSSPLPTDQENESDDDNIDIPNSITKEEIRELAVNIKKLIGVNVARVNRIIQKCEPACFNCNIDDGKLNLRHLKQSTLRELQTYVATRLRKKSKSNNGNLKM